MKDLPYIKKIKTLVAEGKIPAKTGVSMLDIRHDSWCSQLLNLGVCHCDPEIWYRGERMDTFNKKKSQ
jgi:hypothetical protein